MNWKLVVIFLVLAIGFVNCKKNKIFSANIIEDLVKNEVKRKMPSALHAKTMTGVHLKEATDAINKLVDESIVDRVHEAEREVSRMLLKSIEHHIQDAGKALLKTDEDTCKDRIDGCKQLANSNVCETSKEAMIVNCPSTCNFCGMSDELKSSPEKPKKSKKHRKHRKKHHKTKKLNIEEANLIHQNMLEQTIDNSNLPNTAAESAQADAQPVEENNNAVAPLPEEEQQQGSDARDIDTNQQSAEQQQQQAEQEEEAQRQEEEQRAAEEKRKRRKHKEKIKAALAAKSEKGRKRTENTNNEYNTDDTDTTNESGSGSGNEESDEHKDSDSSTEYTTNNVISAYATNLFTQQQTQQAQQQTQQQLKKPKQYTQQQQVRRPQTWSRLIKTKSSKPKNASINQVHDVRNQKDKQAKKLKTDQKKRKHNKAKKTKQEERSQQKFFIDTKQRADGIVDSVFSSMIPGF